MRVQVDQTGHDDEARYIADIGAGTGLQPRTDAGDLTPRERDVGNCI